ncbi:hypothetical protein LC087_07755 [Bacillus carboniphilus]|uniref:Uncharacterized protein n=1 Tax=Bacillus carboniphilus TaxID=86663 RepID=A0ABY9JYY1_9BACI|nr:hypothetical protein [Bacillus carboniphilus]WLR43988.1 hypothetical protein LC087_07755 [Bacillus carboniphilus]
MNFLDLIFDNMGLLIVILAAVIPMIFGRKEEDKKTNKESTTVSRPTYRERLEEIKTKVESSVEPVKQNEIEQERIIKSQTSGNENKVELPTESKRKKRKNKVELSNVRQGIIWNEILNKPRANRPHQYRK